MEDKIMKGTPPMVMLPAKNYVFKVTDEHFVIEIPRRGKYSELAPDFFKEEAGEFEILAENGVLFTPAITKVLFATKKYPDLEFNQLFVPHTFEIKDDTVVIIGQVIELMLNQGNTEPVKNEEEDELPTL